MIIRKAGESLSSELSYQTLVKKGISLQDTKNVTA